MTFDWRTHLAVHPAADEFPLLSETDPKALQELAEDIRENGLQTCIVVALVPPVSDANIGVEHKWLLLDGRNRLDALALLGQIEPPQEPRHHPGYPDFPMLPRIMTKVNDRDAYDVVEAADDEEGHAKLFRAAVSLNVRRRHLTAEQKRDLITKLLKVQPESSDRKIAKAVKADHKTVGDVRSGMVERGEIPHVEKRTDSQGRKQPSKRRQPETDKATASWKAPAIEEAAALMDVDADMVRDAKHVFDNGWPELVAAVDRDEITVAEALAMMRDEEVREANIAAFAMKFTPATHVGVIADGEFESRFRSWFQSKDFDDDSKEILRTILTNAAQTLTILAQEIEIAADHKEAA